jgi:tRNA nucleotidyltransferase (CCA-adding enzyme)
MVDVLGQALKFVEPSAKEIEDVKNVAERSLDLVKKAARKFVGIVDVEFGGSYAKNTWLKGDVDVDIFVKVKPDVSENEFEKIGKELGSDALRSYNPYLRYSQHPYVEAIVDGIRVNVVPCYNVERDKWISAADRSPYHTKFIINAFDEGKRREARLLKKFMKTIGVYGAEIAKHGFSGYVCEVLILKYGSFMNVLNAAAEFRENQVISIEKENKDIVSTFNSALIILDPIDQKRNLGTAISHESVGRFILVARRFIKKPELRYFVSKEITRNTQQKFNDNIVVIKFTHKKRSQDIIWGQLKSSMNAIVKQLDINGFTVVRSTCSTDEEEKGVFAFMFESVILPKLIVKQGPKVFSHNDSVKFLEKNLDRGNLLWVGNDARILALVDNKFTDAAVFLRSLLTKNISTSGVAQGLIGDLKKHVDIYTGSKLRKIKERFIREALGELVATDQFAFGGSKRAS